MKNEFRKEFKIIATPYVFNNFFSTHNKKINEIYEPRKITSLYFDTFDTSLLSSSTFDDVNTFKLRVRTYSNSDKYYKEIKKNTSSGKYKEVEELLVRSFDKINKIHVNQFTLYPFLFTEYERRYFKLENCRITIDYNITFTSHSFRSPVKIQQKYENKIIEYKPFEKNFDIEKYIYKNPVAFSKYKGGANRLYGL